MAVYSTEVSPFARFFLADTRSSWLWVIVRLYVGWEWLHAGWGKVNSPAWTGDSAGSALTGFMQGALEKTGGPYPDVQWWYAWFAQNAVLPNVEIWSYFIAYGELLVGIALILGFLTGVTAFFGIFMNFNFMLAGTVSANPIFFALGLLLILAWRVSGWIGLDRFVLPRVFRSLRPKNQT